MCLIQWFGSDFRFFLMYHHEFIIGFAGENRLKWAYLFVLYFSYIHKFRSYFIFDIPLEFQGFFLHCIQLTFYSWFCFIFMVDVNLFFFFFFTQIILYSEIIFRNVEDVFFYFNRSVQCTDFFATCFFLNIIYKCWKWEFLKRHCQEQQLNNEYALKIFKWYDGKCEPFIYFNTYIENINTISNVYILIICHALGGSTHTQHLDIILMSCLIIKTAFSVNSKWNCIVCKCIKKTFIFCESVLVFLMHLRNVSNAKG